MTVHERPAEEVARDATFAFRGACEECGGCIESEELELTACGDNLCSKCWLQLPKCNFCNQPYCKLHTNQQHRLSGSSGFVCDVCHVKFVGNLGANDNADY
jgi:hypothetical protein